MLKQLLNENVYFVELLINEPMSLRVGLEKQSSFLLIRFPLINFVIKDGDNYLDGLVYLEVDIRAVANLGGRVDEVLNVLNELQRFVLVVDLSSN